MQYKKLIFLLLMFLGNKCFSQSFETISKKIKYHSEPKHLAGLNHKIRLDLYKQGKLNFLHHCDTIFILGSQFTDSGILLGKIWTRNGSVTYSYQKGVFDFDTYQPFTPYECELIEKWDTAKIKAAQTAQLDGTYNYGTRVIKKDKTIKIDNISFNQIR